MQTDSRLIGEAFGAVGTLEGLDVGVTVEMPLEVLPEDERLVADVALVLPLLQMHALLVPPEAAGRQKGPAASLTHVQISGRPLGSTAKSSWLHVLVPRLSRRQQRCSLSA